jgi:DNA polymerase III delta prime subunit
MTAVVEELRDLRLFEVQGLEGRDYLLALTDEGRKQASERMQLCRYLGAAPVNLESYQKVIRAQHADPQFDLPSLREAFSDLVVTDELLSEVGPAAMAGGAMFLYGPPGTGKTSIAERLQRVHNDHVLVPYAIEIDSQIVVVYDPVIHRKVEEQPANIDPRWILVERPFITVGGELTGDMLDLSYQSGSGIYLAPLQMQANNGILVIDDFGRQTLRPEDLLNRWIVPLDRRIDFLSLEYGVKFEVPFDAKIVFSTNIRPEALGDEAFFRRIQSKVRVPPIADDQFDEVLRRVAEREGVELADDAPEHLRKMSREMGDGDLRPYLPPAVCEILRSVCDFDHLPMRLDKDMVERIGRMYFTRDTDSDMRGLSSTIAADEIRPGFDPRQGNGSDVGPPAALLARGALQAF